ncbi:Uncharacterised protein [Mycobacteroides abscessus]|nr:Uncharacterised protein [Mycobacteroides abscessus]
MTSYTTSYTPSSPSTGVTAPERDLVMSRSGRVAHTSSSCVSPLCVSAPALARPPVSPDPGSGHASVSGVTVAASSETTTCT